VVGEEAHYLAFAFASVHNLRREVSRRNQVQVEVVGLVVVSSAEFDLGVWVALHQDGAEALDQGLLGILEDGWLNFGDPWGLDLALGRSSRQL
jgi:hypothetical protein